ncbi:aminotransferase class-V domain-containing protein [Hirsutella rhossiliensis]|uniref:Aminotransferase class-V domain-containing protein n=1 Tax=Hirsutella rhossiliensis TaxID=111463 RepID=A0A9P8NAB6_9HYPO|nr:aminotransferase class-V domain-containing protein [Hirsutella rhossiliensis]KAH0967497.1 aminotransferase class-V domain-containing protein [Hirsutella rhossiliensis]
MGSSMIEASSDPHYPSTEDVDATLLHGLGEWEIRSDIQYLDNGAFGACPVPVAETQKEIRRWIESNPHDFFERSYVPALQASREALASFLNADLSGFVLLPGATYGTNAVIQSLRFKPDDEILTTNHAYSSVRLALEHVARRDGARLVVVEIPLAVPSPEFVVYEIVAHVTPRTRFAVIDHIPSRSGLVFPVKKIVRALEARNVDTLIDGAHAPGMIQVDIKAIGASYYVANCHKWMCSPRGVGFLSVRQDRMQNIKPLVIARSPYMVNKARYSTLEHGFSWMGTYDVSALLSLSSSINFLRTLLPGGYKALTRRNHRLAVIARKMVCQALNVPVPCPESMIGNMASIPLPDSTGPEREGMLPIQQTLWREHGIVIPVYAWPSYPKRVIRLSVQSYNSLDQYVRLAACLRSVLCKEGSSIPRSLTLEGIKTPQPTLEKPIEYGFISIESTEACCHETDQWGNDTPGCLKTPHQDIEYPAPWLLCRLAQQRIRKIAAQAYAAYPVSLYPTAEEAEVLFTTANGPRTRHANMEISRVEYMLSCVGPRRIPQVTLPLIEQLLNADDVIDSWLSVAGKLKNHTHTLTRAITFDMDASRTPAELPADTRNFVCRVVPYATEAKEQNPSRMLWTRALHDFVARVRTWSLSGVESFLQIYAFLKDPVGGPRKDVKDQARFFVSMLNDLKFELESMNLAPETWEEIAAQLALESSFMAHAEVQHTAYIHFAGDEQLVYSYVDMDSLGRSEFATPAIVVGMVQEMMALGGKICSVAPVTVAYGYPISSSHESRPIVVDGNNRVASILFLRFIAAHGVPDAGDVGTLRDYCRDHGLGPICFVDLCAVLEELWKNQGDVLGQLKRGAEKLSSFERARQIPVLITEEPCFLTRTVAANGDTILQPVHQSIFATDDLLVALPAKMQLHGRPKGFRALPIR